MKIQHVPIEYVNQTWPMIAEFLQAAIDRQEGEKDYTLDHIQSLVSSGQWMLLVAVTDDGKLEGAATVNYINRPKHRVAFITAIGGRLITNPNTFQQMVNVLKQFGATSIEGAVDDAVERLWRRYGFVEKYKILGVTL